MEPLALLSLVIAIVFVSALVRSSLGFGDAVVGMPLLAFLVGLKTAAPLVAFMGPTISVLILSRNWRSGDRSAALRLILASVAGVPLGVYGLSRLPEEPLRIALGVIVLAYGLFGILRPSAEGDRSGGGAGALAIGFAAGVLGGAYNTNGPPVVIYGTLRGWRPETFRATLQAYFLPTGLAILAGHGLAGLWTQDVLRLYAFSLPAIVLGVWAGGRIHRSLAPGRFRALVFASLVVMGALLIARSVLS